MNASIVLIEDEAILSRNICIYLGREGLDVAAAASGEEGLDLECGLPDVRVCRFAL